MLLTFLHVIERYQDLRKSQSRYFLLLYIEDESFDTTNAFAILQLHVVCRIPLSMCTQIQRYQNIYLSILTSILIYQNQHKHMLYVKQILIILFDFWYNRVLTLICMVLWKSCAKHMRINKLKLNIKRNNVYLSNYKLF